MHVDHGVWWRCLLAGSAIAISLCLPLDAIALVAILALMGYALCSTAGISTREIVTRVLFILIPAVIGFGPAIWVHHPQSALPWLLLISVRMVAAVLFTLWLSRTVPLETWPRLLRSLGCPAFLVGLISFLLRLQSELRQELRRMNQAYISRSPHGWTWHRVWSDRSQLLAILFHRGLSRAERLDQALRARGWTGQS